MGVDCLRIFSISLITAFLFANNSVKASPFPELGSGSWRNEIPQEQNQNQGRFSKAIFSTFQKDHPIQAKILQFVSDLFKPDRPRSPHSLVNNAGFLVHSNSNHQQISSIPTFSQNFQLPAPSPMQPQRMQMQLQHRQDDFSQQGYSTGYLSPPFNGGYTKVRRSGRFLFPDEYEQKAQVLEEEQEQALRNGYFNKYQIVNNQVRLGRVEAVPRPEALQLRAPVPIPFIPRSTRESRKFEPSLEDSFGMKAEESREGPSWGQSQSQSQQPRSIQIQASQSSPVIDFFGGSSDSEQPSEASGRGFSEIEGNIAKEWQPLTAVSSPLRQPSSATFQSQSFHQNQRPQVQQQEPAIMKSNPNTNDHQPQSQPTQLLSFKKPISVKIEKIPVLRPTPSRTGKSLRDNQEYTDSAEWQLLGTTSGESSSLKSSVGVGSIEFQQAKEISGSGSVSSSISSPSAGVRMITMRPSTIKSQPLIVKDARDGRSLKQIEVQGVKIIVGSKTPDFPLHTYDRGNFVRKIKQPEAQEDTNKGTSRDIHVSLGSKVTAL